MRLTTALNYHQSDTPALDRQITIRPSPLLLVSAATANHSRSTPSSSCDSPTIVLTTFQLVPTTQAYVIIGAQPLFDTRSATTISPHATAINATHYHVLTAKPSFIHLHPCRSAPSLLTVPDPHHLQLRLTNYHAHRYQHATTKQMSAIIGAQPPSDTRFATTISPRASIPRATTINVSHHWC